MVRTPALYSCGWIEERKRTASHVNNHKLCECEPKAIPENKFYMKCFSVCMHKGS